LNRITLPLELNKDKILHKIITNQVQLEDKNFGSFTSSAKMEQKAASIIVEQTKTAAAMTKEVPSGSKKSV